MAEINIEKMAQNVAQKALQELRDNGVFVSRWIPVSERLPEENGYYLTTTMNHEVYCDYWNGECFDRTETVIAWKPLPAPYDPQKKERL